MSLTDVEICSIALVKIGADAISSFDDESVEADIGRRLYEVTVRALITAHPWHFSIAETELQRLNEPPLAGYSYVFALPDDVLRVVSAGAIGRGRGLDYRVASDRLYTKSQKVVLSYQRRPSTEAFPAFFAQALIAKLAAELCLPLTEGTSRAEALQRLAASELKIARLIDSQQDTPSAVEDFTLIAARGS